MRFDKKNKKKHQDHFKQLANSDISDTVLNKIMNK